MPFRRELPKPKSKSKVKSSEDPLVHIATAPNEPLAMMWKEILENENVRSLIKSGDLKAAGYIPSFSPCEIHVLSSQAEEARKILAPFLQDAL